MNVGLLIITHSGVGDELLETARSMLGVCPLDARALRIPCGCDPARAQQDAEELALRLNNGDGVLVLADMFGSTPSNIAHKLADHQDINVVTGVNLPMLIRVLNYPHLSLGELTEKALTGGREGVMLCDQSETQRRQSGV